MSGVMCDVVGSETVTLRKKQEAELEVSEIKMWRFSLGWTDQEGEHQRDRPC